MSMPEFNVQRFKEAIFQQKLFSVPTSSEKGIKEIQGDKDVEKKTTSRGRIWRNIRNAVSSKVNRVFRATPEIREILVGSAKKKISNENILEHIYANVTNVSSQKDLEDLKTTLAALKGFGADPVVCKTVEDAINDQHKNLMSDAKGERHKLRETLGKKDKTNLNVAEEAMKVNLGKALHEHLNDNTAEAYVTRSELESIQSSKSTPQKLKISFATKTITPPGSEKSEDALFFKSAKRDKTTMGGGVVQEHFGYLAGVLDGHGEKGFADIAKDRFLRVFNHELKDSKGNVLVAFEKTFAEVQKQLADKPGGSTAVISYVNKTTNEVYTATLGNSEAMVCRKIDGKWKLIPLSPVRANRSFGVDEHSGEQGNAKPKVTVFQLQPGDRFFVTSDGITDNLEPAQIIALIKDGQTPGDFVSKLVETATEKMKRTSRMHKPLDDASVVAFTVESAS